LNNNRNMNNNNRRRGRGNNNNRQQGGQQLNRIDSRARGNAPQMLEKYRKLAHDAHLNGDRVTEEYYLQFADHYFRVIADQRVRQEEQRQPRPAGANDRPSEFGDEFAEDDFYGDVNSPYDRAGNYAPSMQNNSQAGNNQGSGSQGNAQGNGGQSNDGQNAEGRNNGQSGGYQNNGAQGGNAQSGNAQNAGGENRENRGRRNDRFERGERGERQDRRDRPERGARSEGSAAAPAQVAQHGTTEPTPQVARTQDDASQAAGAQESATVYEPTENPFVRAERAPRAPRARKPRREDAPQAAGESTGELPLEPVKREEPVAALDPASLPPAISRREEVAEEAPAKPKRRTRRAAPPADDSAGTLETVN
jgi:hypothetical protein